MGRRHRPLHFRAGAPFARRQVPFADVICRIARLPQRRGQGGGVFRQAGAIVPDPVAAGILSGKDAAARRSAHRLIRKSRSEQHAAPRHGVQVGRQVHGVETHGPDAVAAELVRDDDNNVGPLHVRTGLRRRRGRSGHGCGNARQPLSACGAGGWIGVDGHNGSIAHPTCRANPRSPRTPSGGRLTSTYRECRPARPSEWVDSPACPDYFARSLLLYFRSA